MSHSKKRQAAQALAVVLENIIGFAQDAEFHLAELSADLSTEESPKDGRPTVLFIDDEGRILTSFRRLFRGDFNVHTASARFHRTYPPVFNEWYHPSSLPE